MVWISSESPQKNFVGELDGRSNPGGRPRAAMLAFMPVNYSRSERGLTGACEIVTVSCPARCGGNAALRVRMISVLSPLLGKMRVSLSPRRRHREERSSQRSHKVLRLGGREDQAECDSRNLFVRRRSGKTCRRSFRFLFVRRSLGMSDRFAKIPRGRLALAPRESDCFLVSGCEGATRTGQCAWRTTSSPVLPSNT